MQPAVVQPNVRRDAWVERVQVLLNEVADWCRAEGWSVERRLKSISEDGLGTYDVPVLHIHSPAGELYLDPIASIARGVDGRVDLEAVPTLSRVKLLLKDDEWRVLTDSNVWIRQPWTADTFKQLVADMLA